MVIAKKCCEMGINLSLFDFGPYLFGRDRIKRKESISEIYKKLSREFFTSPKRNSWRW